MSKNTFETWLPKLVVAPAFVLGFAFIYGLMVWNGVLSLTVSRMLPNYEWAGLAQYERLWEMDRWWVALKNLGIFGVGYVGGSLAIGGQQSSAQPWQAARADHSGDHHAAGTKRGSLVDQRARQVVDRVERAQAHDKSEPADGVGRLEIERVRICDRDPHVLALQHPPELAAASAENERAVWLELHELDPLERILDKRFGEPARRTAADLQCPRAFGPRGLATGAEYLRRHIAGRHRRATAPPAAGLQG